MKATSTFLQRRVSILQIFGPEQKVYAYLSVYNACIDRKDYLTFAAKEHTAEPLQVTREHGTDEIHIPRRGFAGTFHRT